MIRLATSTQKSYGGEVMGAELVNGNDFNVNNRSFSLNKNLTP